MCAVWIFAMACSLSRLDRTLRGSSNGRDLEDEVTLVEHVFGLGGEAINRAIRGLRENTDQTMRAAAQVALRQIAALPNSDFVIPEKTPDESALGTGMQPDQTHIPQFGSGSTVAPADVPT